MEITGVVTGVRAFDAKLGRDGQPLPPAHGFQIEGLNVLVYGMADAETLVNRRVSVQVQAQYDRERKAVNVRALGHPRPVEG